MLLLARLWYLAWVIILCIQVGYLVVIITAGLISVKTFSKSLASLVSTWILHVFSKSINHEVCKHVLGLVAYDLAGDPYHWNRIAVYSLLSS